VSERAGEKLDFNQVSSRALEWPRFLALAEAEGRSEPGKRLISQLADPATWASDLASSRQRQHETQEVAGLLARDGIWGPLQDLASPDDALDKLGREGVLEVVDLALLRRWLHCIQAWTEFPRDEIRGESFRRAVLSLPDPQSPLRILDRILTPEGELSERASPKLYQLHTEIRSLKRDISFTLDHVIKAFQAKGVLQESFSDVRDGRYVIPVRISAQGEVEGTIYEASVSRQTVFIEPKEVSPLNNRLRQRQNELIQEIYVVLSEASAKLRPHTGEILGAVQVLSHWDAVQARARMGLHYGGKAIEVTASRGFTLHQTVHPLLYWSLPRDKITLNEIEFGEPARTLLITGPNTGGKTVLLKTLGLAGICARTGFPFPGNDTPIVPFFATVFADVGDPQSIEAHLSSFSGHILRYREILEHMSDQSLVLIDELNTATDPEEGAALGRAVLETIMSREALVITTTHDPHLKALSLSDTRILSASMQFDESSRTPTYRLVVGVPGRSRALETAERLGIPAQVLKLAREYLSTGHQEFESRLARLEANLREATVAREEAVAARAEAERLKKDWSERTESAVGEMLDRARKRLRQVIEQTHEEAKAQVRKLQDLRVVRDTLSETEGAGADLLETALREEAPEAASLLDARSSEKPLEREDKAQVLQKGMQVRVPKWKSVGTLLEVTGGKVKVQVGAVAMSLSVDDIEPTGEKPRSFTRGSGKVRGLDVVTPPSQIDLRGMRLDDAMSALAQYLDQAYRSGSLVEVTIVHGLGTGAIREGARGLLKELPYVKEVRDGGAGRGGAGATLVEFDRG
jgi:DNA mismatch repair protein MutS2